MNKRMIFFVLILVIVSSIIITGCSSDNDVKTEVKTPAESTPNSDIGNDLTDTNAMPPALPTD